MNAAFVLRTLSVLLLIVSAFMAVSIPVAALSGEARLVPAFLVPIAASLLFFVVMTAATRRDGRRALPVQASYLLVVLGWVAASLLATLPFILTGSIPRFIDAFFEVMSGFTTTGASILSDVEALPRSLLFWRSMTHWLGGMGIVVLTVALFPLLGIGGLRLMDAESPGPTVDKVTPRISSTAKMLWLLYLGLTVLEIVLLLLGGMDLFDAATHAFGTMATGGFSTRNASVGHFRSGYIDWVITVFMFLSGANFTLYYRLLRGQWRTVARDTELRAYTAVFVVSMLLVAANLLRSGAASGFLHGLRLGGFQVASILTTTGFATADFARWPGFSQIVLFVLMFIGGCAGSTGGGIKVVRLVTILKHSLTEMKYMVSPHGVYAVRVGGQVIRKNAIFSVYAFVFLYLLTLFSAILVVASSGADVPTSVTASLATLGNIGPGLAAVGPVANYGHFPAYVKAYLSFAMLAGRLEIYTVLILGTRSFWRR
jgi:trk system potassium uptake protein TrkH